MTVENNHFDQCVNCITALGDVEINILYNSFSISTGYGIMAQLFQIGKIIGNNLTSPIYANVSATPLTIMTTINAELIVQQNWVNMIY